MPAGNVLLFGDLNVDNILTVPEIPTPGHDTYASRVETHLGGAVCNTSVILQRLHQPARMLGAIGQDHWGEFVLRELQRAGVDTRFIARKSEQGTGLIFIGVIPNGERTMFSYRGANTILSPQDIAEDILEGVALVQLSGYVFISPLQCQSAFHLIEMARQRGVPVSLDTGLDPLEREPEIFRQVLPLLTLCITGQEEARLLTGCDSLQDQAAALLAQGSKLVAIKLGSQGAYLAWPQGDLLLPAFQVEVKDTTGAGDAFSAGLIYGWMRGYSPCASGALANALGGLSTTYYGAAWIGRDEVLPFLQSVQRQQPDHPARCGIQEAIQRLSMQA
jgi:ribokinase